MTDLRATTVRWNGPVDLLGYAGGRGLLFGRDGSGLAGRGVAIRVGRHEVAATLAAIEVDDRVARPGTGPVAFGALPFLPGGPADLVVPERVIGRAPDGACWATWVGRDDPPEDLTETALAPAPPLVEPADPGRFEVTSSRPPADWCEAVAEAVARIEAGRLDKVVLAREIVIAAGPGTIPVVSVLARLAGSYPGCFLYSVDGFVGASPELLVARHQDIVRAQPMAGTAPRRGDPQADARLAAGLLASPVYRHEHQVTIDMVHDTLLPYCSYLDYEAEPSVVPLANVAHLATTVEGRLSQPLPSVFDLVTDLHPTPAVCGRPRDAALDLIAELEGLDRGRYAGTVGWVDAAGNGEWAVAIRCAQIDGSTARLWAGNGIVAGADPNVELAETRAKLQALLTAIVRP